MITSEPALLLALFYGIGNHLREGNSIAHTTCQTHYPTHSKYSVM